MPTPRKYVFELEHPYGGRLPGYDLGEAVTVSAHTVPELMNKLSMLFDVAYKAVSPRTKEML